MNMDARSPRTQGVKIVQRANMSDLAAIAALAHDVLPDAWSQASFEAHWRTPRNDLWWICECDGRAAGYLAARRLDDEGEILSLAVSEKFRRQGLASALWKALEASPEWREVVRVHLEVRESNEVAKQFYVRHGFVRVGRRPHYYSNGEAAILMTREGVRPPNQEAARNASIGKAACPGVAVSGWSAASSLALRTQAEVVANLQEAADQYRLRLRVENWPSTQPGQFVMLSPKAGPATECTDPLLARPMAIYRIFAQGDACEIEILYRVVGRGTALLAGVLPGAKLGIVGPLGRGFPAPKVRERSILVGGGSGIASLYGLACAAALRVRETGEGRVTVLLGARTQADLVAQGDFAALDVELMLATEDGSAGVRGLVTEPLHALLEDAASQTDVVLYVCGPTPMMRACAALAAKQGRPCFVSLENPMACGFGVCLGCATTLRDGGKALVCKDGPVFAADRIDWENMGG